MNRKTNRATLLAACAVLIGTGCQDLVVDNTNSPDRFRALSQPDAVEALVASSYPRIWNRLQVGTAGWVALPAAGDEVTSTISNNGALNVSQLPRIPFNNNPVTDDHAVAELYWGDMYEAYAAATDVIKVMDGGLKLVSGSPAVDQSYRARVFSRLAQGMSLGYIGMLFDQAYIYDENTPDGVLESPVGGLELQPYAVVTDSAVGLLERAAELASSGETFSIPAEWLYAPADADRAAVVEMANAYAARFTVLNARTPAERAAVDWNKVLEYTSKVSRDVLVQLQSQSSRRSNYLFYAQRNTGTRLHAHPNLYGPADVSGNWQAWLNTPAQERTRFLVTTPDRRVTGATPTSNGLYFRYKASSNTNPLYGGYRESYYQWYGNNGEDRAGNFAVVPLDEMKLYRAEAFIRLNRVAEAVEIINAFRARGSLPPITTAGVPESPTCVPQTEAGACGSVMDALEYERLIELSFIDPTRTYLDRRGFGSLTTGTFLHLPIPGEQQEILGITRYTFGGSGPGSAQ